MALAWPLLVTALAVAVSCLASGRLGRDTGWLLAALYLGAAGTLIPTTRDVLAGATPSAAWDWVPALQARVALRADGLGIVFAMIALLIGAVVLCYAARYLKAGKPQLSFYLVMTIFTLAMLGLVLADDLYLLFICWEATSIASFLLIARSGVPGQGASMRTLLVTFVGGVALLAALTMTAQLTGTTQVSAALASPVWRSGSPEVIVVAVLIALAGFTKAAQFPFHVWLPDAMAAITPVSAYLHAAAVVKAGIFLLLRFSPAFAHVVVWQSLLVVTGIVTCAIGGWFALQQTDLKRLMAYSTVSQLGLIVAATGVGTTVALGAAILHTIAHALFKSGLFMSVGVIDHAAHTRDLRRLPPLRRELPGTFAIVALGTAAMAGLPPLLGFVSKESVLTAMLSLPDSGMAVTAFVAIAAASVLTFLYSAKVLLGAFIDGKGSREVHRPEREIVVAAAVPIVVGLPLGLMPGVLDPILDRATSAAAGRAVADTHLSLWHGLTPELGATVAIIALGVLATTRRLALWPRLEQPSLPIDGPAVIGHLRRGLRRLGTELGQIVEAEQPARHLAALLWAFAAVAIAVTVVALQGDLPALQPGINRPVDAVVLVLISVAVLVLCISHDRLAAAVALSGIGILATAQLVALGAPDVGLTQLLVDTLTIIVIMLVLQKLPTRFGRPGRARRRHAIVLSLLAGAGLGAMTLLLAGRRPQSEVGWYYTDNATPITGGANIVNVILVEFRALDTLGEVAVLGMTGVAIVAILSTLPSRLIDPPPHADSRAIDTPQSGPLGPPGSAARRAITESWSNVVPLQLLVRALVPILSVMSLLIFLRGHNNPGGGFIAALVAAAIVGLAYVSSPVDRMVGPPRLPLRLIAGGIGVAIVTGIWGLLAKGSFLEPLHGYVGPIHVSSSMLFDVGVYTAVLGMIMITFNLLGTSRASTDHEGGEDTRERADEFVEGELPGPLDTVHGELALPGRGTKHLAQAATSGGAEQGRVKAP